MASLLRKRTPAQPHRQTERPQAWQPFAQFREVVETEVLAGQAQQAILVPSPATFSSHANGSAPLVVSARSNTTPTNKQTAPTWVGTRRIPAVERVSSVAPGVSPMTMPSPGTDRFPTPIPWENDGPDCIGQREIRVDEGSPADTQPEQVRTEGMAAMRNALTLGSSLVFTTAIGFLVNLYYQAYLGPARAGRVAAAESLAVTTLIVLAFGLDNYARKEVALRPGHAKEFVPGVLGARLIATVPFTVALMGVMAWIGRPREVIILLALFGAVRFLVHSNELLAGCLHAVGSVRGLSRQNLVTKAVWGTAILGFLFAGFGVYSIPMGWIVGESLKLIGLSRRTGRELKIWSQTRSQAITPVLRRSVPFLSSSVLTALAMVLDVTMMQFLASEEEVGYYRFAQSMLLLVLILATVMPWVLLPMASKAGGRSIQEFTTVMRRSMGSVMALAIPLCVLLCLNADTVITTLTPRFAPSIPALRILAITAIGTYLTMACATFLQAQGRTWVGVRIGVFIVASDALLVITFVGMGHRVLGVGGAGTAAAAAILVAEFTGTALYVGSLGRNAWDHEALLLVGRMILATVPVVLADRFMAAKGFSITRGVADVVLYGLNVLLLRVVEPSQLLAAIRRGRR